MESLHRSSRAAGLPRLTSGNAARLVVTLTALCGLLSCGDSGSVPTILIVVDVPTVPAGTQSIEVRGTLKTDPNSSGVTDPVGIHITNNKNKFAVVLPNTPQYVGPGWTLELNAYALDGSLCYRQSGSVTADLSPGVLYQELSLQFTAPTSMPLCQLTVDVTGIGNVTSLALASGGSINCGKGNNICSSGFAQNATVTLTGPDDNTVYPIFSSNCVATNVGASKCNITISQGEQRVSVRFVPRNCSPSNWCQYNPYPVVFTANSMWGTSTTDVWAVGSGAELMHYNANGWSVSPSPVDDSMTKVWGTGTSDAWALGSSSLVHYDGTKWTSDVGSNIGKFETGASAGPSAVWVSGDSGRIMHFDGSSWTYVLTAPAALSAMVAKSASDLWAIDVNGNAYHFDGMNLTPDPTLTIGQSGNFSLYASGAGDVWAATTGAVDSPVWRYRGGAWSAVSPDGGIVFSGGINTIAGDGMEVFLGTGDARVLRYSGAAGCESTGTCWTAPYTVSPAAPVQAIWANNSSDVWVGGGFSQYVHYDGKWETPTQPIFGSGQSLTGVWGIPVAVGQTPTTLWSTGLFAQYLSFDGTSVNVALNAGKSNRATYGVVVGGSPEIWAVGDTNSIYRSLDGKTWINSGAAPALPSLPGGTHNLAGVYITTGAANDKHYFVVGEAGFMAHMDAMVGTWVSVTGCGTNNLKAIHGSGLAQVFAVGLNGSSYQVNTMTNQCTPVALAGATTNYNGVYVDGTKVWVVSDAGTVLSYTIANMKSAALTVPAMTPKLNAVLNGAAGSNSVLAVGDGGTILGCNPSTGMCTAQQSPVNANLNGIYAENANDVWAVGDGGTMLRMKM